MRPTDANAHVAATNDDLTPPRVETEATRARPDSERGRVLVVDDEESVRVTTAAILEREGYAVETAAGGAEAATRLREHAYDLVLTDLHMEGGDGLSVLEAVRREAPLTIAIVLTGFASVGTAISALRQDAYDYLTKPCNIEELIHTVRRGLEHRRLMLAERDARHSLEQLNRELEARVRERTAELEQVNAELVAANRAKDVFLATLSHELRTPLTPVLGWVNLLRSSGGASADEALLRQGLDAIERNARLQAKLVDDLLDVSRVVSGKLRVEREPTDLRAVLDTAAEGVRGDAEARGVKLEIVRGTEGEGEEDAGPFVVQGSPIRLQQIAANLLANAVKFTPAGGRVRATIERVAGGDARLVIEDTGVGIAPEFLPYVFDPFRQADSSTTRQHGGLGLGLAIVRALAELHGGSVRAESAGRDLGSRFTVTIPSESAPATDRS